MAENSYSVCAIPTDSISKKRVSGRMAAQEEFAKRAMSGYAMADPNGSYSASSSCLPRPYPKEIARSMGSTALPGKDCMSKSLPKQSYLPEPYSGARYFSPQPPRKSAPEYYARLSSSSVFKPKEEPYKRCMTGGWENQRAQDSVHVMHETQLREGGDTAIFKSSGDSSSRFGNVTSYVYLRDAQTGSDTPLPRDDPSSSSESWSSESSSPTLPGSSRTGYSGSVGDRHVVRQVEGRLPAEGASLSSFVEDGSTLLSTTNTMSPLLRPRKDAGSSKSEIFCILVNVVLFSAVLGIVAAFVVQQVKHSA